MPALKPGEWNKSVCEQGGTRIDVYLAQNFEISRARAQKLIADSQVLCNGVAVRSNHLVEAGDELSIFLPAAKPSVLSPQDIPLEILYQDEHLAVIEKPAGLVVHPAAGHEDGTLVNALLHHFPDLSLGQGIGGEQRPGIVHRIDRNTSGVLLITKTDLAHSALSAQFKEHSISRRYTGLAWGKLAVHGEWNGKIGRDPKDRKRMAIVESGRTALTRFQLQRSFFDCLSLFEATLFTGRTHQIRVHFSSAGFPLVGDSIYDDHGRARQPRENGEAILDKRCPSALPPIENLRASGRQFLHATHLGFTHPATQQPMEFNSPLPAALAEVVRLLESC
jgi:23S rRNA pseudouridine1911/1915/1917 synthase